MLTEPDPKRQLRLYADGNTQMVSRYAEVEEVLHAAAGADPELSELWRVNEEERLAAATSMIDRLMAKGPLRAGLSREKAIDLLSILMPGDNYRRLVGERGWTREAYREWLEYSFITQLLEPDSQNQPVQSLAREG